jgi:hypothetical protein
VQRRKKATGRPGCSNSFSGTRSNSFDFFPALTCRPLRSPFRESVGKLRNRPGLSIPEAQSMALKSECPVLHVENDEKARGSPLRASRLVGTATEHDLPGLRTNPDRNRGIAGCGITCLVVESFSVRREIFPRCSRKNMFKLLKFVIL